MSCSVRRETQPDDKNSGSDARLVERRSALPFNVGVSLEAVDFIYFTSISPCGRPQLNRRRIRLYRFI